MKLQTVVEQEQKKRYRHRAFERRDKNLLNALFRNAALEHRPTFVGTNCCNSMSSGYTSESAEITGAYVM